MRKSFTLYLTIIFLIFHSYEDECDNMISDYLKNYNPTNITNPLVSSGTGYNDFGKYDMCREFNFKYFLNKFYFNVTDDPFISSYQAYIGFCVPEICYNSEKFDIWKEFIHNYTTIQKENIQIIQPIEENQKNRNLNYITIIFGTIIITMFVFGSGIIYYTMKQCYETDNKEDTEIKKEKEVSIKKEGIITNINRESGSLSNLSELPLLGEVPIIKRNQIYNFFYNCFNLEKNWYSIMTPQKETDIKAVYGTLMITIAIMNIMKFVNIFTTYPLPIRNPEGTLEFVRSFGWQIIFNIDACYDVCFFITGFYFAYKSNKNIKMGNIGYIIRKIIYKIARWYPVYLIVFFLYLKVFPFTLDGPMAGYLFNNEVESCNKNYSYILFMLQDFYIGPLNENKNYYCFEWSWFGACLLHYYIIGCVLIFILSKFRKYFYIISGIIFGFLSGYEFWILKSNSYGVTFYEQHMKNENNYYENYYTKFYMRITTYLMGIIFGVFYAEQNLSSNTFLKKLNKNMIATIIVYITGVITIFSLIFCVYFSYETGHLKFLSEIPLWAKILYNCISRKMFIIGVIFILLPLMKERFYYFGGFVNEENFAYLSKAFFATYLISPIIIRFILLNARYQLYFNGWYFLFYGLSVVALSYLFGLMLTLFFMVPIKMIKRFFFQDDSNQLVEELK